LECIDLDASIERTLKEPLGTWIQRNGWTAFRRLESEALGRALEHTAAVVACGAGVVECSDNLTLLSESNHQVIWLDIDIKEQSIRLGTDSTRPRLEPDLSFEEELQKIDLRRRVVYQQIAGARVDAQATLEDVLERCLSKLGDVNVGDRH
jgi:shikimate kinase